jgi:pimeloyl-ACP methyl ester carboxylesterase
MRGKPVIISLHGRGGNASQMNADPYTGHFIRPLAEAGYPVLSLDAGGGFVWGNQTTLDAINLGWAYAKSILPCRTDKFILLGFSMGGLTALNYVKNYTSNVLGALTLLPAVDLVAEHDSGNGWITEIETAYGGSGSWLANSANYDPWRSGASDVALFGSTIPIKMWYASNDTAALTDRQQALLARHTAIESTNLGAVGHTPVTVPALDPLNYVRKILGVS